MFETLEKQVGNRLILPGQAKYEETKKIWNSAVEKNPAAIIVCETPEDIASSVLFANENNLGISIRGGGHHLAGLAVCDDGLMIDLSKMRSVTVDEDRMIATVEGGATLGDIDAETQKYGLAVPTGTVSATGVAGLALNGGLGYLRGKYGLTCDNIVGAKIVTAEGELIEVNEQNHPDLFWAIRGGGGNFGVVASFEFKLHQVGPDVLAVDVMYDYQDAKQILLNAQKYIKSAPDEVSFNLTATILPPAPFLPEFLHFKKVVMISGMYAGNPNQGESVIQPLRELAKPIVDQSGVLPFVELQKKLDVMVPEHVPVYGTSLYFDQLSEPIIDELLTQIDNAPAPSILVQLWGLSGQMNRIAPDETAFAIRDAQFVLLVDVMAMDVSGELCQSWVDTLYSRMLPHSYNKTSYLNAVAVEKSITKRAYQENYSRLVKVKQQYDPQNRFAVNHNINPNEEME